jgi:hypothetical protein
MLRTVAGRPGRRRLLVSYFLAASLRCQASSVAGAKGKTPAQRRRGMNRVSAANQVGRLGRTAPGRAPVQHRVLVPEHQQLSVLRPVTAGHPESQAEQPAHEQVDDLHQHPVSQASPHQPRRRNGQVSDTIEFSGGTGSPAGGYGSAALFVISSAGHPSRGRRWRAAPSCEVRLLGNGTNSRRRRASPEGACRVEHRCAAIGHPRVLPGWPGCGVRGSGRAAGPARRPRCGWRRRACPGRASHAF